MEAARAAKKRALGCLLALASSSSQASGPPPLLGCLLALATGGVHLATPTQRPVTLYIGHLTTLLL
jgi:hypothetical protein